MAAGGHRGGSYYVRLFEMSKPSHTSEALWWLVIAAGVGSWLVVLVKLYAAGAL